MKRRIPPPLLEGVPRETLPGEKSLVSRTLLLPLGDPPFTVKIGSLLVDKGSDFSLWSAPEFFLWGFYQVGEPLVLWDGKGAHPWIDCLDEQNLSSHAFQTYP